MKKILIILGFAGVLVSCGSAEAKDCKEDCKKECCTKEKEHADKKCEKDCKKACCAKKGGIETLTIGADLPTHETKMKDISGAELALADIKKENGLLVIFSCNTCPFVVGREGKSEGWENRYNDVKSWAEKSNVGFVLVNSNEGKRAGDDSFEKMQQHAIDAGYDGINYVVDENHVLADLFGANTTPHVFLFNKENKLVYTGAIDDNVNSKAEVKEQYLANALTNLAAGSEISPAETKNLGCSIKRVKK